MRATGYTTIVDWKSRAWTLFRTGVMLTAAAGLSLTVGRPAQALNLRTFTLLSDTSETHTVNFSDDGGLNFGDYSVGRYKGSFNGGPAFNIFCVDSGHVIHYGDSYSALTDYRLTDAAGSLTGNYYQGGLSSALTNGDIANTNLTAAMNRAGEAAYLIDQYLNATSATFVGGASGNTNLVTNLAAVQMSLWDILQDGGDGLNVGNFRTNGAAQTTYGSIVSYYEIQAFSHNSYMTPNAFWIQAPESSLGVHAQDFAANTPEPGKPAMFVSMGVSGVGFLIRKRRRK